MQIPETARRTRTCSLWFDGVVYARFHDRAEVTLDDARENLAVTAELTGGHRAPVVVDLRPIRSQSAEARAYFAGSAATSVTLAVALIENIQREDLNPLEEAAGIQRLVNEFGLTHQAAAEALGRSRTAITNLLRLLELAPPVRDLLAEGKLDMGHARALLVLPALKQVEIAQQIAAKGLTVREVEKRVGELASRPKPRMPRAVDRDVARLEEELAQKLGTSVQLKQKGQGRGLLIVEYRNLDQLDALMDKLKR